MKVYVDADACPAKEEILLVCKRHGVAPIFVANAAIASISANASARMEVVAGNFDAADDWMIEHAVEGDLILTGDLLLAQRAARKKVAAMNFSGGHLSDELIHDLVARREVQKFLREMSLPSHHPAPYGKQSRSHLKASLHQWLETRKNRPV